MTIISKEIYELPEEKRIIRISNVSKDEQDAAGLSRKQDKRVCVILPTYNERENILLMIPVLEEIFEKHGIDGHVMVIDDNSEDGTAKIAIKLAKVYQNMTVIQRPGKLGLGSAYRLGFKHAIQLGMDVIFMMDADLSHRPSYIPDFLACMDRFGSDLVVGSRYCADGGTRNWPRTRKLISHSANFLSRCLLGIFQTRDMTSGFRAFKREVLEAIDYDGVSSDGYAFVSELLFRAKEGMFKINEIPIVFHERELGNSKLGAHDIREFLTYLVRSMIYRARKLFLKA